MDAVDVVWCDYPADGKDTIRSYWDCAMLNDLFDGDVWRGVGWPGFVDRIGFGELPAGNGAVVVVQGRYHANVADVARLREDLARLPWALVMLVGDEESTYPVARLEKVGVHVWVMTPHPDRHRKNRGVRRFIGEGYPPWVRPLLAGSDPPEKTADWFLSGTCAHPRRVDAFAAAEAMPYDGTAFRSPGFTQGYPPVDYLGRLAAAKVAPCPSGPATPDSFRLFESLEAGCVPVADGLSPRISREGYWRMLFDDTPPFPIVTDWGTLGAETKTILDEWPATANRVGAWWMSYKRTLAYALAAELVDLSGQPLPGGRLADLITVVMPTSPIPAHPDDTMTLDTIRSVRDRLPDVEILVMCDGVRPEQEHRRADYDEYLRRLLWHCNHGQRNVMPILFDEHQHQANMTRATLETVRTPLILFVEHDAPLLGPNVEWDRLAAAVLSGDADLIRLHHEANVLEPHRYLMLDETPVDVHGVPMLRTLQWSQRPHLASAAFYRRVLKQHFPAAGRTMIEDRMVGLLEGARRNRGADAWDAWRLWLYASTEGGNMKRSTHSDGRAGDDKYEMDFGLTPGSAGAGA